MAEFDLMKYTHRRYNPLSRSWILVSPHRGNRPWQGQVEKKTEEVRPQYDPECYLCPGNERANKARNPQYFETYVFDNDFPALIDDIPKGEIKENNLILAKSEKGICRVICFSPRHDLSLAEMEEESIRKVVDTWCNQYREIGEMPYINYVQIFENKGAIMGCSNPHPHGQIWATESVSEGTSNELISLLEWNKENNSCLLCDYKSYEQSNKIRLVCKNENFIVVVPFWAVWPFETLVISNKHIGSLLNFHTAMKKDLANILKQITVRYDKLFETSFPYSMGIHQSPTDGKKHSECHFHIHFYPPLLRSATIKKFMVGYEMLAELQRDLTPEISAEGLRKSI